MENKKIKILAIDDNRDNLITLKAIISEVIPESIVYVEISGQGGIESARKNEPDVILLDIIMPGMDGYEVCRILKADKQMSDTPIIFVTALNGEKQSRIMALEAGGEAFLSKPLDSTELKAQILAMLKIKEAAKFKRDEKLLLEDLIQKRTEELKNANIASLNLLEDLNAENEIRKKSEVALRESEKQFAFLAGTAFDLIKFNSTQKIYEYTARKLFELLEDKGIVAIVEYDTDSDRWKMKHFEGIQNKMDELAKIIGFDVSKLEGEISTKYYDKIIGGKLEEVEFDFPGLFNNKVSDFIGKAVKKTLSIDKLYSIAIQESEKTIGNITLVTKTNTKPLNAGLIEAFVQQVTNFIKKQKSEEALRQNEEKLKSIFRVAPSGIGIENNRILKEVNFRVCEMTGYTSEELIGQSSGILYPSQKEFEFVDREKYALIAKHGTGMIETHWQRKDGTVLDILLASTANDPQDLSQGIIFTALDISKLKQAEESLKLLNRAVDASSVSVVITDAYGNINYVNPYFTKLTGYSFEEAQGENPRVLKSGNMPKIFYEELWNTILSGKEWTGEFNNRKKNGELFWEKAVISPILNSEGKVVNFVAIKDDITERKKMMEELVAARERAEESDRLKSAFLANMSHEIRTPMNGILGFSELLKEPGLSGEQQQEYIKIIGKSGARMLNIINDIVDISKIESGLIKLDISESNVNEQIEYIHTFFKPEAEAKGIKLSLKNKLPQNEAIIKTDREKLYAILTNLVKNAIKYTAKGSIEFGVSVETRHALSQFEEKTLHVETLHALSENPEKTKHALSLLQFYVKDTGIGIPKDRQEAIFERFIQADIEDRMAYQGAGLGLAITKAYVEMLGGKIWVESDPDNSDNYTEEGKGSTFYFTLPYNNDQVKEIVNNELANSEKNNVVRKLKILIAEDDEVSEMLIDNYIKIFSKEILNARTGVEAVEVCRENPDTDLILMDIRMPDMDGLEATREIRKFNRDVVIIAQTAFGLTGDKEKALESGCNDYIAKPIKKLELQSLIIKHFEL